jgi:hypothetical protein
MAPAWEPGSSRVCPTRAATGLPRRRSRPQDRATRSPSRWSTREDYAVGRPGHRLDLSDSPGSPMSVRAHDVRCPRCGTGCAPMKMIGLGLCQKCYDHIPPGGGCCGRRAHDEPPRSPPRTPCGRTAPLRGTPTRPSHCRRRRTPSTACPCGRLRKVRAWCALLALNSSPPGPQPCTVRDCCARPAPAGGDDADPDVRHRGDRPAQVAPRQGHVVGRRDAGGTGQDPCGGRNVEREPTQSTTRKPSDR